MGGIEGVLNDILELVQWPLMHPEVPPLPLPHLIYLRDVLIDVLNLALPNTCLLVHLVYQILLSGP